MAFQPISHFDDVPPKPRPTPFITVNAHSTGYMGGGLFDMLGQPRFLRIEYDAVSKQIRIRRSDVGTYVKNQTFALPRMVVEAMANHKYKKPYAQRYAVEESENGWWTTTTRINHRGLPE